jgi:hypothetical protein
VKAFLNTEVLPRDGKPPLVTRLEDHLSPSNVSEWLLLLSQCGLDLEVDRCIAAVIENELTLGPGVMTALREKYADKLASAWQETVARQQETLARQQQKLAGQQQELVTQAQIKKKYLNHLEEKLRVPLLESTRFSHCPKCHCNGSVYVIRGKQFCIACHEEWYY